MRIQNNIPAINAHRKLFENSHALSKNMTKLSSGYRVNSAADDAAGLAISEKMRTQIRGLNMASKNSQDGVSLIQTADAALNEMHKLLHRMRELAVQSATDTNETQVDRAALDLEFHALKSEIDDIAKTAEFNKMTLLDGRFLRDGVTQGFGSFMQTAQVMQGVLGAQTPFGTQSVFGPQAGLWMQSVQVAQDSLPQLSGPAGTSGVAQTSRQPIIAMSAQLTPPTNTATFSIVGQTITITGNGVLDLSSLGNINGYTVQVNANNVLLRQTEAQITNITITAAVGTNLFIEGLSIRNDQDKSAISFSGAGNTLNLIGVNTFEQASTATATHALIRAEGSTILTINTAAGSGTGELNATISGANSAGAAIGGNSGSAGGNITIAGGTINATISSASGHGAAIGGGAGGGGGTIRLLGGDIHANVTGVGATGAAVGGGGSNSAILTSGVGANLYIDGGRLITAGRIGAGNNSASPTNTGAPGIIYVSSKDEINRLFNNITTSVYAGASVVRDMSGAPLYRTAVQISGINFVPNTNMTYTIGVSSHTSMVDSNGTLFLYLPAANNGQTIGISIGGKFYEGTLGISNNHNNVVTLTERALSMSPTLTTSFASRDSDGSATVHFYSNKAGTYHYIVQDSSPSAMSVSGVFSQIMSATGSIGPGSTNPALSATYIIANGVSGAVSAGLNSISLSSLTPGDKTIFIVNVDADGNHSNIIQMSIPGYEPVRPPDPGRGLILQVGANSGQLMSVYIDAMSLYGLGLTDSGIATQESASKAINEVDVAVNIVSMQRARLGAYQNRLEHKIKNLDNQAENVSASESRIRDADMAKEMTSLARKGILVQASTAMLAQANTMPQAVLHLLTK